MLCRVIETSNKRVLEEVSADELIKNLNIIFKLHIVWGLDNGAYTFAELVDGVYLRNIMRVDKKTFKESLNYYLQNNSYIKHNDYTDWLNRYYDEN